MKPIKSIKARAQTYKLKNFSGTAFAKRLKSLKNTCNGKTCFIVGNGPSLSAKDLDVIRENKVPCFAFNRIYLIFDKTQWRPDYYVSQDEKMLKGCVDLVNKIDSQYKFIPLFHKYYHDIKIDGAYYFKLKSGENGEIIFSRDISEFAGDSTTVAFTAAQLAAYMGFKRIFLLGIDHSFSVYQNDSGEIIRDSGARDYFTEDYNKDKARLYIPNLEASERAFKTMKSYCVKHDIEVYNATRGGRLEVFERIDFDKIFSEG